ncbi:hypothetical protein M078_2228, partial [Bacteroides fragilis str. 2-F-2 
MSLLIISFLILETFRHKTKKKISVIISTTAEAIAI